MRQPLVAGNWKLHGSRADNRVLLDGIIAGRGQAEGCRVMVCPPFVYLAEIAEQLRDLDIQVGAQNVSAEATGAFTGEVAASMLADVGVSHVIVGHSERRSLYGETDAIVARKFLAARAAGLVPVVCVGETLEQREAGETAAVVSRQVQAIIDADGIGALQGGIIA
ncbi:MAG TPA: triose-phosphate isomerase, partial [Chromatiales bacterium]|nr:triose-phosphate isomerase [Chromatiales bacterium]